MRGFNNAKVLDLAYLMRVGDDTQEREVENLLVWAIPTLTLSEDDPGTELHKEHRSRAAGLNHKTCRGRGRETNGTD